jgi:hypothetical protein
MSVRHASGTVIPTLAYHILLWKRIRKQHSEFTGSRGGGGTPSGAKMPERVQGTKLSGLMQEAGAGIA